LTNASKQPQPLAQAQPKRRGQKDEGLALIVAVRILQFLIIVVLWLFTSYFGASCLDRVGFHPLKRGRSDVVRRSQPEMQRA
jgi:hypothetical protein